MTSDGYSLLVVEDNEFNVKIVMRMLEKDGYTEVAVAENGVKALEMIRDGRFDLVLLDIEMPEMDGVEVLQSLKSDMRLREIPVIMISSVEETDLIVKCIELGADEFVRKPFNPTFLRARVSASLEKKRLLDQQASYVNQMKAEKKRSDELLSVILPSAAANELKTHGKVQPRRFDNVALLFCDIVGFTAYCDKNSAEDVVSHLQALIERFEDIAVTHEMEKIKTIGDEFMATAGLLSANLAPLMSVVKCGLDMVTAARELDPHWEVRVGVHCGPVVAGIVGRLRYQFDVWGDTVNTAARMASYGNPGTVTMAHDAWLQVQDEFEGRMIGRVDVKGKGQVDLIECYGLR